jgi:chromosome segregation ATPase
LAQESFHLGIEIGTLTRNLEGSLQRIVYPDRDHRSHEEKFENLEQKFEEVDKKLADFEKRFSDFSAEADKHKAQSSSSVSPDYLTQKQASLSDKLATAREVVSDYKEKMENLAAQTPSRSPKPSG